MRTHREGSAEQCNIYGVWRLQSYYVESVQTAERTEVFGPNPTGVLILLPEGRMTAMLTPGQRKRPETEKQYANAFRKLVAYSGLYRLEPPDRFITSVDVAWFEPWVGSEQPRTFHVHDDVLEIISGPNGEPLLGNESMVAVLSWVRETYIAAPLSNATEFHLVDESA